eukprot:CAMPEP_0197859080 /NCGR_PEP_ID=MMETSP1438-20131217/33414_1 /TAXON_ID=1461541 /ORGANISM="Pterosperma sp., Strain CCMP1384" /LENGTH=270 /DNA_ID=CAMNT_0043475471 /DNA_START=192 /DNA_END=1004 /DNA_ORIENTATION=+
MAVDKRIGFIGAGMMAEALAKGFIDKGVSKATSMIATDTAEVRRKVFSDFGIATSSSNSEVVKNSDIIFIAVKPYVVREVLEETKGLLTSDKLIVSIAAGITVDTIQAAAGGHSKVVRVMPNTPCLVGETAAAMAMGSGTDGSDEAVVKELFGAVGAIHVVAEKLLDAVTGLSGSGPAYVFMMIEALSDGGVKAGLPRDVALSLAAQTVKGAAEMVLTTGKHPGQLKDAVTSPGGTTIAGVHELEKGGMRANFINAVEAAAKRSTELSKL